MAVLTRERERERESGKKTLNRSSIDDGEKKSTLWTSPSTSAIPQFSSSCLSFSNPISTLSLSLSLGERYPFYTTPFLSRSTQCTPPRRRQRLPPRAAELSRAASLPFRRLLAAHSQRLRPCLAPNPRQRRRCVPLISIPGLLIDVSACVRGTRPGEKWRKSRGEGALSLFSVFPGAVALFSARRLLFIVAVFFFPFAFLLFTLKKKK